ncbi:hypothetical protein [Actinomadura sp. 3N508]|uniref:hypothetical protein n=1 Tax=Actinomadura sp. 3N508 TaxID=3375153 RepID=UPI0037A5EA8A
MNAISVATQPGYGALELDTTRSILIGLVSKQPGNVIDNREPRATIDGEMVPCGWGVWHYPLLPGQYELTMQSKGSEALQASLGDLGDSVTVKLEIREGEVTRLDYAASPSVSVRPNLGPPPQQVPGRRGPLRFAAYVMGALMTFEIIAFIVGVFKNSG